MPATQPFRTNRHNHICCESTSSRMDMNFSSTSIRMIVVVALIAIALLVSGCSTPMLNRSSDFAVWDQPLEGRTTLTTDERVARLAGPQTTRSSIEPTVLAASNRTSQATNVAPDPSAQGIQHSDLPSTQSTNVVAARPAMTPTQNPNENVTVRAQSPTGNTGNVYNAVGGTDTGGGVQQTTYQYPELSNPGNVTPSFGLPSPNVGSPNELNPLVQPFERGGNATFADTFPQNYADIDVYVQETQTGRINFGGAYNSDNGIVGQFIIDERNFDITRFPRSFRDVTEGTAWRGGGQSFRLELVPGAMLQRYLVSFSEPYFLNTDYSFSASGYLFERRYFDWDESRLGGRVSLGRRLNQEISVNAGVRMESVTIDNPRLNTSPQLNAELGNSNLFLGNIGLIRDTRDNAFLATKGTYMSATYSQAFGDYSFSRGDLDYRRYRLMYERPDGSGRHTISYGTKLGFSGSGTPIFENYFAGGFSTLRGFDFRGAGPMENGVRVGGEFQWLNTLEYMFPLTADDMIKGVMFCDFGTVEEGIELKSENFRVAPGFGFRIHMPAAGIGAPLAFDFAFPIATADGDDERIFSFYLGVLR